MVAPYFKHIFYGCLLLFLAIASGCRKDDNLEQTASNLHNSSVEKTSGTFLAKSGKLKVKIDDTTYVFDAVKDSIAFVNVDTAGNRYFGLTAINNGHNVSFGISGLGTPDAKVTTNVAGSQLLFNNKSNLPEEYTLSKSAHKLDLGNLHLKKYHNGKGKVLAKGTFTTYLAKDTLPDSPLHKVTGSFDLEK
ncbi:hypothetical protein DJ568_14810 [Mucilaginibacter hurinus]|uniref:Uncharacterized protein n=1 Tax=Mucilaginibacter hurinus TaxID=2201324 RepID=A0A367GKZ0_9SPHI|nr:hypothetical protein [Mucilaginibacter hurinus]RCH54147.1 hypothetical protein DJ568_14810 [Mucilaginibacter hurinus]